MAEQKVIVYDDEIFEGRKKYKKNIGDFQAIGRLGGMDDIFKRLRKVSKSAFDLFDDLKDTRDYRNNLCFLDSSKLTNSQKTMRQSRIKELRNAGLILKAKTIDKLQPVKKGTYMINPNLIKCTYDPEGSIKMWKYLNKKGTK